MSYLESTIKSTPTGLSKILYLNWALIVLLTTVASIGFLVLYSIAGGSFTPWAEPQMKRFAVGLAAMLFMAMIPLWFWRGVSVLAYIATLALLVAVAFVGIKINGSQRWLDVGPVRIQPSEFMKITLIMMLAAYYHWLPAKKTSHPVWVIIPVILILVPVALVIKQPDLGTSILLIVGGASVMFVAGVHWAYFVGAVLSVAGSIPLILKSQGTRYQVLKDYHYDRIRTMFDKNADQLNEAYQITQAKIALGSGGWSGKGFMQGTQSRLNFLPEKQTDFIFTMLAEEFGFIGGISLLVLYLLILVFCAVTAISTRDRFGSLVSLGMAMTFFLFFAVNMSMVMELAPVVGVPLPMVSYGGSAMVILMLGFGLVQSAHVHRPR